MIVFGIALLVGLIYTVMALREDLGTIHSTSILPVHPAGSRAAYRAGL